MQRRTMIALALAVLALIAGLVMGDFFHVFANASLLCFSCIGIG